MLRPQTIANPSPAFSAETQFQESAAPRATSPLRLVAKWGIGFLLATVLIWVYGILVLSDVRPKYFDSVLKEWTPPPGRAFRVAEEGWGSSVFNQHGLQGLLPADHRPLIVFWGDSFVEGSGGVEPNQKMQAVVTEMGRKLNPQPVAVSAGFSGANAADVYFAFQRYRNILPRVALNVLLVNPHNFNVDGLTVRSGPGPVFAERVETGYATRRRLWNLLATVRANFLSTAIIEAAARGTSLRFRLGPIPRPQVVDEDSVPISAEQLRREIHALKQAADGPLLIILRPDLPHLRHGEIDYSDPHAEFARTLRSVCAAERIDFVYPIERFRNFTRQTDLLPVGFSNTVPDVGHFNQYGHRLIAETVIDYLLKHGYVRR